MVACVSGINTKTPRPKALRNIKDELMNMTESTLLVPQGTAMLALTEERDPRDFFQTSPGLWVSINFHELVVANAEPVAKGAIHPISYASLTKDAKDEEIESALQTHLFNETALCAVIAELISNQPNGKDGILLNGNCPNLFYTGSCVTCVTWEDDCCQWGLRSWEREGSEWVKTSQVFFIANK